MVDEPASLLKPDDYKWSWADFDDWFKLSGEDWFVAHFNENVLSTSQKLKVLRNKNLLSDRDAWNQKTDAFAKLLSKIGNEEERRQFRSRFVIHFSQADFKDDLRCKKINFPCDVIFDQTTFEGGAEFQEVRFKGNAQFQEAMFGGNTVFEKATFEGSVIFDQAKFMENASFQESSFEWEAIFDQAKFEKNVTFRFASFVGSAWFDQAKFESGATFDEAKFEMQAGFNGTVFEKTAVFAKVRFEGSVSFGNTKFDGMFATDMVVKKNLVANAKFTTANFNSLTVNGTTNLSGSEFEKVPDFTNSKLDRPPEVAGMKLPPPNMIYRILNERGENVRYWPFKLAEGHNDVAKYRKLKAMALAANDHEKDGEFFAYEMMAKRGHETSGFWPLLFNSLYSWLSFYGQKFMRPVYWMAISYVAFFLFYIYTIGFKATPLERLYFSAEYTLRNVTPLIGSFHRFALKPEGHQSWFDKSFIKMKQNGVDIDLLTDVSIIQQFIGLVLLFFFLLALRNKFRLK